MTISRSTRIKILLVIDVVFFFVELLVGYAVGSLALVADSFHMLNDVMSLIVALYAIKLTAQSTTDSRYSYGWHRAEILAALINGVFLLALCFSIFLEAIERFFSTPEISNPRLVVIVGSLGLASNIVGLFLFQEHGHSHGHSHGPSPSNTTPLTSGSDAAPHVHRSRSGSFSSVCGHPAATRASLVHTAQELARTPSPLSNYDATVADEHTALLPSNGNSPSHQSRSHGHSHAGSMNMRALVLHVLGDALGNIGVIATGLVIWLSTWSFKYYFDPVISLVITVIIFSSAMPLVVFILLTSISALVRSASFILLQGVPSTISLDEVSSSILAVEGVLAVHELHVWQLSETKIVASVHVMASRDYDFMPVAAKIREVLHHHGIHSSTVQPEYLKHGSQEQLMTSELSSCLITCPQDYECDPQENSCCPPPSGEV